MATRSPDPSSTLLESLDSTSAQVFLLVGDRVIAEPAAQRLADELARRSDCEVQRAVRPASLADLLADLRTYSLFGGGKVALVIDSAVLSDRSGAADLIDQAARALPISGEELATELERECAGRLLIALRLFGIDAHAEAGSTAMAVLEALPDWALAGGAGSGKGGRKRRRGKRQIAQLRDDLAKLLEAAWSSGLHGWAVGDQAELAKAIEEGLPEGHYLVLAEASVAKDHPSVERLARRAALLEVGSLGLDRRGKPSGLEAVAAELGRETGVTISREALAELARRTLRKSGSGSRGELDASSSERLAAEYRKLATLSAGRIELQAVLDAVEDRGDEDVWQLLDDVGKGKAGDAMGRLRRLIAGADDPMRARLSSFSLIADFCRQIAAVDALVRERRLPPGERSYKRFQVRIAPGLQSDLADGVPSPLGKLHPFRLFRVYEAASRLRRAGGLERLAWRVLEAETRLKGESGDPDAALAELVAAVGSGTPEPLSGSSRRR